MKLFLWTCTALEKHLTKDHTRFAGLCGPEKRAQCERRGYCENAGSTKKQAIARNAYSLCRVVVLSLREPRLDEWRAAHSTSVSGRRLRRILTP